MGFSSYDVRSRPSLGLLVPQPVPDDLALQSSWLPQKKGKRNMTGSLIAYNSLRSDWRVSQRRCPPDANHRRWKGDVEMFL